jgi:segregation and condensation protein A
MSEEEFKIKTEGFEGPLDVLLSLIEKRKFLINDISLAKVADDYIAYVQSLSQFPIAGSANFILIASTLLLIKSKSLLPTLTLTEEEAGSIEDLEERLKLYKKYKELSAHIAERFGKNIIYTKNPSKNIPVVFSPEKEMNGRDLLLAIKRVIQSLPKKEILPKAVVKKMISLEEMIERLTERVQTSLRMNFAEFAKTQGKSENTGARHIVDKGERVNIIVSFLAMLELIKQGVIEATQESHEDDISIETKNLGVPTYN